MAADNLLAATTAKETVLTYIGKEPGSTKVSVSAALTAAGVQGAVTFQSTNSKAQWVNANVDDEEPGYFVYGAGTLTDMTTIANIYTTATSAAAA